MHNTDMHNTLVYVDRGKTIAIACRDGSGKCFASYHDAPGNLLASFNLRMLKKGIERDHKRYLKEAR